VIQNIVSAEVKANGELHLPKSVRQALHLRKGRGLVGFVIEGGRVLLTKAAIVPHSTLTDEELAELARLSRTGTGRRSFHTQDAALRYLWSL
jgi:bifunctional DNA-binding transcriptional regulator/antitoxin component of YhaV-PrlF toxin-antitoxin module